MSLRDTKSRVVILGMHRSGTSLLVGLLEQYGYQLGVVSNQISKFKPTGTKENIELRRINNKIFQLNNCTWNNPKENLVINDLIINKIKKVTKASSQYPKWAIKDPRMLLTYNFWLPYLPNHKIISTIRCPIEVAQSLFLKNKLPFNIGIDIWHSYNTLLLQYWRKYRFPILNFNLCKQDYFKQFLQLNDYLSIRVDGNKYNLFYQHKTVHAKSNCDFKLSSSVVELYNELLNISNNNIYDR